MADGPPTAILEAAEHTVNPQIKEPSPLHQKVKEILTGEQQSLLKEESLISDISLDEEGKFLFPPGIDETENETSKEWVAKDGVIDAKNFWGTLTVIFNSHIKTPEGIPADVRERGRTGEFDPFSNICYTDIWNSFNYMKNRFDPEWVQQNVRHELRHALVSRQDEVFSERTGKRARRVVDQVVLKEADSEAERQLNYLDELHSQYFDVLDGEVDGHDTFRTINSDFQSIEGQAAHTELASTTEDGKQATKELFYLLQGMILLKRSVEANPDGNNDVDLITSAAGVVLATERSSADARDKIRSLWNMVSADEGLMSGLNSFLKNYDPSYSGNKPVITEELKIALGLNPER